MVQFDGSHQHEGSRAVLVVNDREDVAGWLHRRYPDWNIEKADTYLSAISKLSQVPVNTIVAYVDVSQAEIETELAGLREAAGSDARVVLCCKAEAEPLTRQALGSGADEYLIYPLHGHEVDTALLKSMSEPAAESETRRRHGSGTVFPTVAMDELRALADVVSRLDAPPEEMLTSLAELLRTALHSTDARVVVEGSVRTATGNDFEPELVEPIYRDERSVGHVAVGPRASGTYEPTDTQKMQHYAKLIQNIVAASWRRQRWHELAYTDELTGLPNRRFLLEFLHDLLGRPKDQRTPITLLMFDIDDFKSYNDKFGHDAGDEIIRGCGEMFSRNCRDHDVVTRYGGDEFVVVFWDKEGPREPGSHHPTTVLPIIERCRRSLLEKTFEKIKLPRDARLTISGGLASFPTDATNVENLLKRADEALYHAKRDGKNCIYLSGANAGPALSDNGV